MTRMPVPSPILKRSQEIGNVTKARLYILALVSSVVNQRIACSSFHIPCPDTTSSSHADSPTSKIGVHSAFSA